MEKKTLSIYGYFEMVLDEIIPNYFHSEGYTFPANLCASQAKLPVIEFILSRCEDNFEITYFDSIKIMISFYSRVLRDVHHIGYIEKVVPELSKQKELALHIFLQCVTFGDIVKWFKEFDVKLDTGMKITESKEDQTCYGHRFDVN